VVRACGLLFVVFVVELKAQLEAGLAEFDADPNGGFSWDEVKKAARDNSWRTV
jgi:hypothetical protein